MMSQFCDRNCRQISYYLKTFITLTVSEIIMFHLNSALICKHYSTVLLLKAFVFLLFVGGFSEL